MGNSDATGLTTGWALARASDSLAQIIGSLQPGGIRLVASGRIPPGRIPAQPRHAEYPVFAQENLRIDLSTGLLFLVQILSRSGSVWLD